jgi:hypothetical protein
MNESKSFNLVPQWIIVAVISMKRRYNTSFQWSKIGYSRDAECFNRIFAIIIIYLLRTFFLQVPAECTVLDWLTEKLVCTDWLVVFDCNNTLLLCGLGRVWDALLVERESIYGRVGHINCVIMHLWLPLLLVCINEYEWGGSIRRPLHRDHFLIYFASPTALLRQ